jgi:type II secretory pathway pseudopilin PulG
MMTNVEARMTKEWAAGSRRPLTTAAFTLVEIILALALSSVLLAILVMAVRVYLRATDVGRTNVEQAQLARAILQRFGADLRNVVYYNPATSQQMLAGAMSVSGSSGGGGMSSGVSGGPSSSSGSSGSSSSSGSSGSSSSSSTVDSQSEADGFVRSPVPGLYGTAQHLEVDVSYVPRLQEMRNLASYTDNDDTQGNRLSDIKTIAYFMAEAFGGSSDGRHGLVRREMDYTLTASDITQGTLDDTQSALEPIAPEVVALTFQYTDGQQWLDTWDTTQTAALPLAVKIQLALARTPSAPGMASSLLGAIGLAPAVEVRPIIYQMVVALPTASATAVQAAEAQAGTSSGSTGSSMGSGTGSSNQ